MEREKPSETKRREAFFAQQRSLARRRSIVGLLGFIPLGGALGCGAGVQILCAVPQEGWLLVWAAIFGSFLGITIRLVLERRRFMRAIKGGEAPLGR